MITNTQWFLKKGWEVLPVQEGLMLRSADQAYTVNGDVESQLLPIMVSLLEGSTVQNLHEKHDISVRDSTQFVAALQLLDAVTDDKLERLVVPDRTVTLTETVKTRLNKPCHVHLPESGGIAQAVRDFATCSPAYPLLYGVRLDADYFAVWTTGEWWLHPHELLQRLYRGILAEEDLPLMECLVAPVWPGLAPYFTDAEAKILGDRIVENVAGPCGIWQISPDGTEREITTQLAPPKTDGTLGLPGLESLFVGPAKIVAECNTLALVEKKGVSLAFAAARVGFPYLTAAHVLSDSWNWGTGQTVEEARTKAIVEGLERYSCGRGDSLQAYVASYRELGEHALHPRDLGAYDPALPPGYYLDPFDEDKPYAWYRAHGIYASDSRWVLPDFVLYPLEPQMPDAAPLYYGTSSGSAGHTTLQQAQENALAELCEREALMITWYNRLSPPRVDEQMLPLILQQRLAALREKGYQVYVLDFTLDLLPTAGVIAIGQGRKRLFTFGMSASTDFMKGIEKALSEVEIMLLLAAERDESRSIDREQVRSPHDHATYYMDAARLEEIRFLFDSSEVCIPANKEVQSVEQVFRTAGLSPYYVDVTCREVAESGFPVYIVRALVPGMVPIAFGYGLHPLGMERLYSVPVKLGKRATPLVREEVDLDAVHPFC